MLTRLTCNCVLFGTRVVRLGYHKSFLFERYNTLITFGSVDDVI